MPTGINNAKKGIGSTADKGEYNENLLHKIIYSTNLLRLNDISIINKTISTYNTYHYTSSR